MTLHEFNSPPPRVDNVKLSFPCFHVLLVTLDRPAQLNALPRPLHAQLHALWSWYDAEPKLRCAVITGRGRAFCAGADLKEWNESHDAPNHPSPGQSPGGFGGLSNRRGKKPVIAAVNGLCLGGGMEMAINADMVLASPDAKFGLPEVKIGVIALAGALPRLSKIVGRPRASEMALLGRTYSPHTMREWGIVNKVVKGNVVDEALRWATDVACNSPDSVIVSRKGLLDGWEGEPIASTGALADGLYRRMDGGDNMREGVLSFVEKRRPVWKDSKL